MIDVQHQEDLEALSDHPLQFAENTKGSWETIDGEQRHWSLRLRNSFHAYHSDPSCIQERNQQVLEYLHCMTKEDMETVSNEQENQGDKYPIETWFQIVVQPQYHSILQHLLEPYQSMQLVPHIQVSIQVYFSKLNMSMFVILLRTWLHWKFSYT
jgi:hypothetical protein